MKSIVKLLPTLVAMLLATGIQAHGETYYVSPSGTSLSGLDPTYPAHISKVAQFIDNPTSDNEVIIRFAPGVYELTWGIPRNVTSQNASRPLKKPCFSWAWLAVLFSRP